MSYSAMSNSFLSWARGLSLALVLAGVAHAATPSPNLKGSYTGLLLISQGPNATDTRLSASANVVVAGSKKAPKITITGVINSATYEQTIKFNARGDAVVSSLLPGIADFSQPVKGRFIGSKVLKITGFFDKTKPDGPPSQGKLQMQISKSNYNSTLMINSAITFENDSVPIYVTVIAL